MASARFRSCGLHAAVLAALLVASGCGSSGDARERAGVVVTTGIWGDVVRNVTCGDLVEVEVLIPDGADPHGFEPSLADRGAMDAADLVVINGLELEEGLVDTLDAVADAGTPIVAVADAIEPLAAPDTDEDHATEEDEDHDDHGGVDPHVWMDPVRVAEALPALADRVAEAASLDREQLDPCVDAYVGELRALDEEIRELLEGIPAARRNLVTNHEALGYFADRYDFRVIGTVIPASSTLAESNPAQLEALAEVIREVGTPAIFAEDQQSTSDADALAASLDGVEVVTLFTGALGGADVGADTYIGMLRVDAQRIADALG